MRRTLLALTASLLGPAALAATPCEAAPEQALAALNALRARPQACGAAAGPLRWNARLAASARQFAQELSQRDSLSHEGQVLPTLVKRVQASGYQMGMAGENLAAGPALLDEVLGQWLASPEHCENLMQPAYQDAGMACVNGPGRYGHYWVLHLGRSPASP